MYLAVDPKFAINYEVNRLAGALLKVSPVDLGVSGQEDHRATNPAPFTSQQV